jgi:hypothetical protein
MLSPLIDQRGDFAAFEIIETPPNQRKAARKSFAGPKIHRNLGVLLSLFHRALFPSLKKKIP